MRLYKQIKNYMAGRADVRESALTDEDRYAIFNLAMVLECG